MRIAARKTPNGALSRREQLTGAHRRAEPLRKLFPALDQLRIELVFSDPRSELQPSPQRHTLFAAAPAFFRFACPCADCDGDFNLADAVADLIASPVGRKRASSSAGQLSCPGVRFRDHALLHSPCGIQLSFQLLATPHGVSESTAKRATANLPA